MSNIEKRFKLTIPSKKLLICDPCYIHERQGDIIKSLESKETIGNEEYTEYENVLYVPVSYPAVEVFRSYLEYETFTSIIDLPSEDVLITLLESEKTIEIIYGKENIDKDYTYYHTTYSLIDGGKIALLDVLDVKDEKWLEEKEESPLYRVRFISKEFIKEIQKELESTYDIDMSRKDSLVIHTPLDKYFDKEYETKLIKKVNHIQQKYGSAVSIDTIYLTSNNAIALADDYFKIHPEANIGFNFNGLDDGSVTLRHYYNSKRELMKSLIEY